LTSRAIVSFFGCQSETILIKSLTAGVRTSVLPVKFKKESQTTISKKKEAIGDIPVPFLVLAGFTMIPMKKLVQNSCFSLFS